MSKRLFLYCCWCLLIIVSAVGASYFAWSPFTDEQEDRSSSSTARFHHK